MQLLHLDESQNFADEVFTSIVNQGSDLVTAFTIMKRLSPACFHASMIVLGVNCVVRLVVGLITVGRGEVLCKSCIRVLLGLVFGMIEPVSGNALLASGLQPYGRNDPYQQQVYNDPSTNIKTVLNNSNQHLAHMALVVKLKNRQRVEFTMAVLEDLPELVIDGVFLYILGRTTDEELTSADVALFVFSAVLSMYHIAKCIWTFVKFRSILKADKTMTADQAEAAVKVQTDADYGW
jgi:hypothetical protein